MAHRVAMFLARFRSRLSVGGLATGDHAAAGRHRAERVRDGQLAVDDEERQHGPAGKKSFSSDREVAGFAEDAGVKS
ncbi:MAG: hypothetical protein M5U09_03345 [Gammaproteobacteria bacterium]|nr:hypothetical protein [Gammaproteobacteria bacterium]